MKALAIRLLWLCLCYYSALGAESSSVSHKAGNSDSRPKRPITVKDSIESNRTMLDDYRYPVGVLNSGALAVFSPDKTKFVVAVRKGNVRENTNQYSLLLFRTEQVHRLATPEKLIAISSSSNREAVKDLTWLADNETIAFLGENPKELRQLYTFNVRHRILKKLTNARTEIESFSMTPDGSQFTYVVEQPVRSVFDQSTRRNGHVLSHDDWISDIVDFRGTSVTQRGGWYGNAQLYFVSPSGVARRIKLRDRISEWSTVQPFLSPDGEHILIALQAEEVPKVWTEYFDPDISNEAKKKLPSRGYYHYSFLRRYVFIDTHTGKNRILLNAPIGTGAPHVAWAPNGRSVVVSNVYLPLEGTVGAERELRQSHTFTVELAVPNGKIGKITQEKLNVVSWDAKTNRLLLTGDGQYCEPREHCGISYEKHEGKWERHSAISTIDPLSIVQEESINIPPRVIAIDPRTGKHFLILDLNPQFSSLRFAHVEEIEWRVPNGHTVKGGLYYPVDYVPGEKYPLVIQTHGWDPKKFMIDGSYPTGFAAQELAGKGIMVVQADENVQSGYLNTPNEAPGETSTFEALIDDLARKGMIDRERVGLIGFSRTGFHVKYAITHSRYPFAAASVIDSFDGSYMQYLLEGAVPESDWEKVNGGPPFGDGLKLWLEHAPDFNIENAHTPLRIVSETPDVALADYFWYAASRRLGLPVEMVVLQSGEHYLRKPWDQMVASQGNVDWFCFWLKGKQDADPAKAQQYARWGEMRRSAIPPFIK